MAEDRIRSKRDEREVRDLPVRGDVRGGVANQEEESKRSGRT